ncbi:MAG: nucleotide-binding protein [Gammaproteobacteria bacterium]
MARARSQESKAANLFVEQMRAAIPKLDRRIADLEDFDVATVSQRFDPVAATLAIKVNGTLQDILGHDTDEYRRYSVGSFDTLPLIMGRGSEPLPRVQEGYKEGIHRCLLKLKTLRELFEERIEDAGSSAAEAQLPGDQPLPSDRRVFVVHGHDHGAKESIARYLSKLDLEPVILHEQPNQGRTVIEKFEAHTGVAFAVVLLTPDDMGHAVGKPEEAKPRARQNVVLELGFFMSALGRDRVCVLYKGGVEIPSDYSGILYHSLDDAGGWRFLLAKEMKASGIDIDLNKVT